MSTMKYSQSDDSDSGGDDASSDGDPQELAQGLWLCDTGSGHDLTTPSGVGDNDVQKVRKIVFKTANGRISTDRALNLVSSLLRGPATPYILPETPWVLSIGKRVMEMGYSFVWVAKTAPWLISPDGHRIDLEVHGNIPFLRVGEGDTEAMVAQSISRFLPSPADDSDVELGAPCREVVTAKCTSSFSALTNKPSVTVLDSDEESILTSEESLKDETDDGIIREGSHEYLRCLCHHHVAPCGRCPHRAEYHSIFCQSCEDNCQNAWLGCNARTSEDRGCLGETDSEEDE